MSKQQHRQTRVGHCQRNDTDVYIGRGRGGTTMRTTNPPERGWLGNPYTVEEHGREEAIRLYRAAFERRLQNDPRFRRAVAQVQGQILGCWCQRLGEDEPGCHGEVVAEWADRLGGEG